MTGYELHEIVGKSPRILQGYASSRYELNKIRAALKKWEPCEIEIVNYRKNSEPFWVSISIVPLADETGWYTHWISIQKDITERKKMRQKGSY
jgi:PAS domain S-box-containing protein